MKQMKFLLAKKVNMTQIFDEVGKSFAVTVLSATPSKITPVKTITRDRYKAHQIGFGEKKEKNINKIVPVLITMLIILWRHLVVIAVGNFPPLFLVPLSALLMLWNRCCSR